ncbi:MerR family transcriptional regulator [Modestobacter sp. VKM Ac-2983]|uniref:helix-turn-helix domain-containing protein n=1 Tax=Modestobacter sp. VKM Ac-2983 TaxID=3004137 RepID=UPI0022ABA584|nr:MerR family transcriptional regulator [Modestobacter sp. VKM Ac-2983]MCZ2807536.1 MerR family transcriptional regulator [Modestobacter sp. VKM Ac-2983]
MVSIGALARLAGTTTRTIRHYHAVGLLPEPSRLSNGYRDYDAHDAAQLLRVRRLVELGLSLPGVTAALGSHPTPGAGVRDALLALDADLAQQAETIGARRRQLADLLAREDLTTSEQVADLLRDLTTAAPGTGPDQLRRERDLLELLETSGGAEGFTGIADRYRAVLADPAAVDRIGAWAARFEALAGVAAADPVVTEVATELRMLGPELFPGPTGSPAEDGGHGETAWAAFLASLTPAQRRCVELAGQGWPTCAP